MALTALLKSLIFMKRFDISAGASFLTGLNNLQLAKSSQLLYTQQKSSESLTTSE